MIELPSGPGIDQHPDFREVVDAAADWLDGADVLGRDGTWAGRTLRHVTAGLPLDD